MALDSGTLVAWAAPAGVIVALMAVMVALFGPYIERWYHRPVLRLGSAIEEDADGRIKVSEGILENAPTCWLRLPVTNTGRGTAEDVRVILLRVGPSTIVPIQPPSRELKWADVPFDSMAIPPQVTRLIDVVRVSLDADKEGVQRLGAVPGLNPVDKRIDTGKPGTRLWLPVKAARYEVELVVSAKDVRARRFVVRFQLVDSTVEENAALLRNAIVANASAPS